MPRIVVITGASSGIGKELKKKFEELGDTVYAVSLEGGEDANHHMGDVTHEIKMRQVFNDIYEKYGRVDILINNAGVGMSGITELLSTEEIQKVMNVNFYGIMNCVRYALPLMSEGSKIINMSSAMALFPVPFRAIYGAVKSAVLNFSFALKMELKPLGIDVTAICPGDVKTNFTANRLKNFKTNERYGDRIKTATEKNDAREEKRIPCEVCAEEIFKIINKKKLRPFYIIGGKYKWLYFLTRITPKSWLLNITAKMMDGVYDEKSIKVKTPKATVTAPIKEDLQQVVNLDETTDTSSENVEINQQPKVENSQDISESDLQNKDSVVEENQEKNDEKKEDSLNNLKSLSSIIKKKETTEIKEEDNNSENVDDEVEEKVEETSINEETEELDKSQSNIEDGVEKKEEISHEVKEEGLKDSKENVESVTEGKEGVVKDNVENTESVTEEKEKVEQQVSNAENAQVEEGQEVQKDSEGATEEKKPATEEEKSSMVQAYLAKLYGGNKEDNN